MRKQGIVGGSIWDPSGCLTATSSLIGPASSRCSVGGVIGLRMPLLPVISLRMFLFSGCVSVGDSVMLPERYPGMAEYS